MHLYSLAHPTQFCIAAEIQGIRTRAALGRAVEAVARRHPVFSARITTDDERGPALVRTGLVPELRFVRRSDVADWREVVGTELVTIFDPAKGPLLRVTVVEGPGDMVVILSAYHAVCDGVSMTFVLDDLLAALSGKSLGTGDLSPPMEDLVARHLLPVPMPSASVPTLPADRDPKPPRAPVWRTFDGIPPVVQTVALDRRETALLTARCRAEGTTVHGALAAALAVGLSKVTGQPATTLYSPLNVRKSLRDYPRTSCMMIGGLETRIDVVADFWGVRQGHPGSEPRNRWPSGASHLRTPSLPQSGHPALRGVRLRSSG